jgi:hypothetical protein
MKSIIQNILGTLFLVAVTLPWLGIFGPEYTYWALMVRLGGGS